MSRAYAQLKAASNEFSWKPDIEILVLGGFVSRVYQQIDADAFSEATVKYCFESGLPVELVTKVLCGLVDEVSSTDERGVNSFSGYLAGVISEFRKLQPDPEAQTPAVAPLVQTVSVSAEVTSDIDNALKNDRPLTDVELGGVLIRWSAKLSDSCDLCLDVINSQPTPALAISIARGFKVIHRHHPVRLKQWVEMATTPEGCRVSLQWVGGCAELVFLSN